MFSYIAWFVFYVLLSLWDFFLPFLYLGFFLSSLLSSFMLYVCSPTHDFALPERIVPGMLHEQTTSPAVLPSSHWSAHPPLFSEQLFISRVKNVVNIMG